MMKTVTFPLLICPAGIAREAVRGFFASISASISLFSPMAAVRAPIMASRIQSACAADGSPRAASRAPVKANGSAKSVWENLIISRKTVIRPNRVINRVLWKYTMSGRHQAPAFELTGHFCNSAAHYATADKLAALKQYRLSAPYRRELRRNVPKALFTALDAGLLHPKRGINRP